MTQCKYPPPAEYVPLKNALAVVLKKEGLAYHQVCGAYFGRSVHGISFPIYAGREPQKMVATVYLIQRKNGTWRKKVELATWLEKLIDGVVSGDVKG